MPSAGALPGECDGRLARILAVLGRDPLSAAPRSLLACRRAQGHELAADDDAAKNFDHASASARRFAAALLKLADAVEDAWLRAQGARSLP